MIGDQMLVPSLRDCNIFSLSLILYKADKFLYFQAMGRAAVKFHSEHKPEHDVRSKKEPGFRSCCWTEYWPFIPDFGADS
jgi:hypothetical protein